MMKHGMLLLAVGLAGCESTADLGVGTSAQALTEGQVNALNNVGRDTGITYQLVDPPEPDMPQLNLWFRPVDGLERNITVTGDPPGGVTGDPPGGAPVTVTAVGTVATGQLNFLGDGLLNFALGSTTTSIEVTGDPPGSADPPGGLNFRINLIGNGTVTVYRDGATAPACTTSSGLTPLPGGGG